jgi:type I restriction enzyme S subunit
MKGWQALPLSQIAVPSGKTARIETGLPVYSVTKHRGFVASLEYFKKQVFSRELGTYTVVEPGEFAYATIHLDEGSIGICPEKCLISPMYTAFRIVSDAVHPPFVLRYLKSPRALAEYPRLGNGSVERRRAISFDRVGQMRIPLPPLPKQRWIAEVLDRAEALRAKRRAALAQLDTLTQSIFLEMFGDPIHNPRDCAVRLLIDLVDPERPISYGILMPGPDQALGVKYVRVVDMKDGGIEITGIRKTTKAISDAYRRSLLKSGDLLLSIRGHVGRLAVVPPELDGANITQDTARLAINGAAPIFVRECLRTDGYQRWMAKYTKGVAVRGINLGDVKLIPIILPPQSTQDDSPAAPPPSRS